MKHFTKMYLFYIGFKIDSGTQLVETFSKNHEIHKKKKVVSQKCWFALTWAVDEINTAQFHSCSQNWRWQFRFKPVFIETPADWSHDSRGMRKLHATAEVSRTISQQPHKCWSLFCRAARGNKTGQGRRAKSADLSGLVLILLCYLGVSFPQLSTTKPRGSASVLKLELRQQ